MTSSAPFTTKKKYIYIHWNLNIYIIYNNYIYIYIMLLSQFNKYLQKQNSILLKCLQFKKINKKIHGNLITNMLYLKLVLKPCCKQNEGAL